MILKVINKQYNLGSMEQEGAGEAQGVSSDQQCYINCYIHIQINKKKIIENINKHVLVYGIYRKQEKQLETPYLAQGCRNKENTMSSLCNMKLFFLQIVKYLYI